MTTLYEHTDRDGRTVAVEQMDRHEESADSVAVITADGAKLPSHEFREFCQAVYTAGGHQAPDLPDIPDPKVVEALAKDLQYAGEGTSGEPSLAYIMMARTVLALGWKKDASA